MKYSQEQKSIVKKIECEQVYKSESFKKDKKQINLQKSIDNHYPAPEKYQILESSINK